MTEFLTQRVSVGVIFKTRVSCGNFRSFFIENFEMGSKRDLTRYYLVALGEVVFPQSISVAQYIFCDAYTGLRPSISVAQKMGVSTTLHR